MTGSGTASNSGSGVESNLKYNLGLFKGVKTRSLQGNTYENLKLGGETPIFHSLISHCINLHIFAVVCKGSKCMFSCGDKLKDDINDILSQCPYTNDWGDLFLCETQFKPPTPGPERSHQAYGKEECDPDVTYDSTAIGILKLF